ncbi:MAG: hypothetical protein Q9228_004680 [Teloschistes exilis]
MNVGSSEYLHTQFLLLNSPHERIALTSQDNATQKTESKPNAHVANRKICILLDSLRLILPISYFDTSIHKAQIQEIHSINSIQLNQYQHNTYHSKNAKSSGPGLVSELPAAYFIK